MSRVDDLLKGSEFRLWQLIDERTRPGANVKEIDQRIWDLFGEDWAVMMTDLSGFSRRVAEFGIIHFLQVIHEQKRLLLPIIGRHDGILIKIEADSFLVIFKRPDRALACAVAMQQACQQLSKRRKPEEQILLCVGLGYGRILRIGDVDVFGAQVNAASKLGEDVAQPNEILLTREVVDAVGRCEGVTFEPLQQSVGGSEENYRARYDVVS